MFFFVAVIFSVVLYLTDKMGQLETFSIIWILLKCVPFPEDSNINFNYFSAPLLRFLIS